MVNFRRLLLLDHPNHKIQERMKYGWLQDLRVDPKRFIDVTEYVQGFLTNMYTNPQIKKVIRNSLIIAKRGHILFDIALQTFFPSYRFDPITDLMFVLIKALAVHQTHNNLLLKSLPFSQDKLLNGSSFGLNLSIKRLKATRPDELSNFFGPLTRIDSKVFFQTSFLFHCWIIYRIQVANVNRFEYKWRTKHRSKENAKTFQGRLLSSEQKKAGWLVGRYKVCAVGKIISGPKQEE